MAVKQIKRRKKWWIVLIAIWIVFFLYSNINSTPKREMIHFNSINVSGTEIIYNLTIQKIATPLFYQGNTDSAILLLHGFGGTPYEMQEMAEYLAKNNITVYIPLLAGHGTNLRNLKKITWQEDYKDVEEAIKILQSNYTKVYIGGLCNGGLLSLEFASRNNLTGVISLSSPVFLSSKIIDVISNKEFLYFLRILTPYTRRIEYGISKDPIVQEKLPSNDLFPVNGLITTRDLTLFVRRDIQKINTPVLIIQSTWDNRASPESANFIYSQVSSKIKKLIWLNNSGHVITLDYDKQQVFEESLKFINEN